MQNKLSVTLVRGQQRPASLPFDDAGACYRASVFYRGVDIRHVEGDIAQPLNHRSHQVLPRYDFPATAWIT
ncbi:hypothetical protein MPLA_770008 [Mesorhizobium sp. ORS 3359]|nr:hypothetical protein MPLA_770008 [Mesorhizobium sp. ORS 3359]